MHADTHFAKDGMAHWPREDNVESRSLQLPLELRATYDFGEEGVETEARRPGKKKKKTQGKRKEAKDGLPHWPREDNAEARRAEKKKRRVILLNKNGRKQKMLHVGHGRTMRNPGRCSWPSR